MKSAMLGTNILAVEVTHINGRGLWLLVKGKEYFLPYEDFPWFKDAKVSDILNVKLLHEMHLHWPKLDVDLDIESLNDPGAYPLVAK
jgi:hypothetical protein